MIRWFDDSIQEMNRRGTNILIHLVLLLIAALTLMPFAFVLNNSLRTNTEQNYSFFGLPQAIRSMARFTWYEVTARPERITLRPVDDVKSTEAEERRTADQPMR